MLQSLDAIDRRLLDGYQRGFPLVPRPFEALAGDLGLSEDEVLSRLHSLVSRGAISRIGATVRPNTVGASTLAAMAVPEARLEEVAAIVSRESGVNHSYLREDDWNLWFVATAPDTERLAASICRIEAATSLPVLDLRLVRPFNIDLGFSLDGRKAVPAACAVPCMRDVRDCDRAILQVMTEGLPLVPRPYDAAGASCGLTESIVIARLESLHAAGIISRIGVIVRHRAVGWTSNAMVVWDVPADRMERAGLTLAAHPGVTLCYQRRTVPGVWSYGLFCMIHARSRVEAERVLDGARRLPELAGVAHRVLYSVRCFKQTGALLLQGAAA